MGHLRRVHRFEDDERKRANAEIRRLVNRIPDRELAERIPLPGASPMPPPDELGISWDLLWRAAGRPDGMNPSDGSITPGISDADCAGIYRRVERVMRPLLDRLYSIDKRRTR